jgi:polysaccharide export outer membrane protein
LNWSEGHPEWSGEFTIKPDGNIYLRDIGDVNVQGKTRDEVRDLLCRRFEQYINNPRVAVEMVQLKSQVIYVLGEVNRPGEYSTGGKLVTLKDSIVMPGLPARFAATGRVFVITPGSERAEYRVMNLERILYRGELKNNIVIKPGDIVYVPKTLLGKLSDLIGVVFSPLSTVKVTTGLP